MGIWFFIPTSVSSSKAWGDRGYIAIYRERKPGFGSGLCFCFDTTQKRLTLSRLSIIILETRQADLENLRPLSEYSRGALIRFTDISAGLAPRRIPLVVSQKKRQPELDEDVSHTADQDLMRISVILLTTPEICAGQQHPKHVASGAGPRGRAVKEYAVDVSVAFRYCKPVHEGLSDGGGLLGLRQGGTALLYLRYQCPGVGSCIRSMDAVWVGWIRENLAALPVGKRRDLANSCARPRGGSSRPIFGIMHMVWHVLKSHWSPASRHPHISRIK